MRARRTAQLVTAAAAAVACVTAAGPAVAAAARPSHHAPRFRVRVILDGARLTHTFIPSGSAARKTGPLSSPDDITMLGGHLFAGFQNGVGPQGEPSADGNTDSTVVEFSTAGLPKVRVRSAHAWETDDLRWVPAGEVGQLDLHPGFRQTWEAELREEVTG